METHCSAVCLHLWLWLCCWLQQVDHFQYLGAMITDDESVRQTWDPGWEWQEAFCQNWNTYGNWKSRSITLSTKLRLLRSLVWPVGTYRAEAWSFGKREQQRLLSFETICYRRVLRVPWTTKRRNEDILEEVGGRQLSLWNSVVARKLRYFGHIMRKEDGNLEMCIITGMAEGTRGRGRPRRAWSEDIKDWTHLSTEEALRLTRHRAAWISVVHHAANVHDSE